MVSGSGMFPEKIASKILKADCSLFQSPPLEGEVRAHRVTQDDTPKGSKGQVTTKPHTLAVKKLLCSEPTKHAVLDIRPHLLCMCGAK